MENKYYVISNFIFLAYLQKHCQMKTLHIEQPKNKEYDVNLSMLCVLTISISV